MDIVKKSGKVAVRITTYGEPYLFVDKSKYSISPNVPITPVTATLMIQALQEYLDGLSVSQPVDYVKPIAE